MATVIITITDTAEGAITKFEWTPPLADGEDSTQAQYLAYRLLLAIKQCAQEMASDVDLIDVQGETDHADR